MLKLSKNPNIPEITNLVICIPSILTPMLLYDIHSSSYSGHPTAKKLERIVKQKFFVPNLKKSCQVIVQNCSICTRYKAGTKLKRELKQVFRATGTNQVVHTDIITISGKHTQGITHPKYTQVLTFVDGFSNFLVTVPVTKIVTGEDIFDAFIEHWVCKFGSPRFLLSDNAKNFQNDLVNLATRLLQIQHVQIAPYMSRGNLSERIQRAFLGMIATAKHELNVRCMSWPFLLHFATLAWNNSPSEQTGISPAFIFLGRENMRGLRNFVSLEFAEGCDDYCRNMILAQEAISRFLDQKKVKRDRENAKNMSMEERRKQQNAFPERTLVYVRRNISKTDPLHKLRERYVGPYIVTKEFDTKVRIQPFKNEDIVKDVEPIHILGHGRHLARLSNKIVDKTFLKKCKGLTFFSPGMAKELKNQFFGGIDFKNLEYTHARDSDIVGEEEDDSENEDVLTAVRLDKSRGQKSKATPSHVNTWCDSEFWQMRQFAEEKAGKPEEEISHDNKKRSKRRKNKLRKLTPKEKAKTRLKLRKKRKKAEKESNELNLDDDQNVVNAQSSITQETNTSGMNVNIGSGKSRRKSGSIESLRSKETPQKRGRRNSGPRNGVEHSPVRTTRRGPIKRAGTREESVHKEKVGHPGPDREIDPRRKLVTISYPMQKEEIVDIPKTPKRKKNASKEKAVGQISPRRHQPARKAKPKF